MTYIIFGRGYEGSLIDKFLIKESKLDQIHEDVYKMIPSTLQ
jgi:hypothetical protein